LQRFNATTDCAISLISHEGFPIPNLRMNQYSDRKPLSRLREILVGTMSAPTDPWGNPTASTASIAPPIAQTPHNTPPALNINTILEADVRSPFPLSKFTRQVLTTSQSNLSEDADSALGSPISSYSSSLASSILNYKYENGRRYHAYREGEYPFPNDEREQDRMDLLHHIFRLMLGGALFRAPISSFPQRILDFGTGTGIWAIDMADEYPSAEVIGTDLSPIQPTWVPPNCKFWVDDVESDWNYRESEAFDFIHGRGMAGGIRDWPRLFSRIYTHLRPGGWLEMQEFEAVIRSEEDPDLTSAPWIKEWQGKLDEASSMFGKGMNVAATHKDKLVDAGFVDVHDDVYRIPIGRWAKDPKLKELGMYEAAQVLDSVEPFTLGLFTRVLKYRNEEAQVLMAGVRSELRNSKLHLYLTYHFTYGRKPGDRGIET
jgi:SAM-dependent methyltransferase